jgi:hypothetical protein
MGDFKTLHVMQLLSASGPDRFAPVIREMLAVRTLLRNNLRARTTASLDSSFRAAFVIRLADFDPKF